MLQKCCICYPPRMTHGAKSLFPMVKETDVHMFIIGNICSQFRHDILVLVYNTSEAMSYYMTINQLVPFLKQWVLKVFSSRNNFGILFVNVKSSSCSKTRVKYKLTQYSRESYIFLQGPLLNPGLNYRINI